MRAHTITTQARVERERRMKRGIVVVSAVVLGAAVIAAEASGNQQSVSDPRGDVECLPPVPCSRSLERSADIVKATAGHAGERLKHTVTVAGRFGDDLATLDINTDSDARPERCVGAYRGEKKVDVIKCAPGRCPPCHITGPARVDFHRHSVEISFSEKSIGGRRSYGWDVGTLAYGKHASEASDRIPAGGYIQLLGGPPVPSASAANAATH